MKMMRRQGRRYLRSEFPKYQAETFSMVAAPSKKTFGEELLRLAEEQCHFGNVGNLPFFLFLSSDRYCGAMRSSVIAVVHVF